MPDPSDVIWTALTDEDVNFEGRWQMDEIEAGSSVDCFPDCGFPHVAILVETAKEFRDAIFRQFTEQVDIHCRTCRSVKRTGNTAPNAMSTL